MNPRIGLAIVHGAHIPERVPLYERLLAALKPDEAYRVEDWYAETTRAKHYVWMPLILDWFAERQSQITHGLVLQDDILVPESFWPWLSAMLQGRPTEVICLHNGHPGARQVFVEGLPGYYTFDALVGQGYVAPIETLLDFRQWRLEEVRPSMLTQITEDSLFALYCMARRKPIFAPVPSIMDHDIDVGSTNPGFDEHLYRKPQVTWKDLDRFPAGVAEQREKDMSDPLWWGRDCDHVGKFYDDAYEWLPLVMRDKKLAEQLVLEYKEIKTPPRYKKFFMRASSKA